MDLVTYLLTRISVKSIFRDSKRTTAMRRYESETQCVCYNLSICCKSFRCQVVVQRAIYIHSKNTGH
jgi:hypothetical protein